MAGSHATSDGWKRSLLSIDEKLTIRNPVSPSGVKRLRSKLESMDTFVFALSDRPKVIISGRI